VRAYTVVWAYQNASLGQLPTSGWPAEQSKRQPSGRLQQRQRPLGQTQLATADKDGDHIGLVSQSELHLPRNSIWSAHGNSDPPDSNAANRLRKQSPRPLGSPPPALATQRPARSHLATEHEPNVAGTSTAFIGNLQFLSKHRNWHPTQFIRTPSLVLTKSYKVRQPSDLSACPSATLTSSLPSYTVTEIVYLKWRVVLLNPFLDEASVSFTWITPWPEIQSSVNLFWLHRIHAQIWWLLCTN
jgi:hypothetical protein